MTLGFTNWFLNLKENHRHYHLIMIISSFYAGMIFMLIGIVGLNISEIFAISFILSSISFASGFYHIIDKVRKNQSRKCSEAAHRNGK